MIFKTLEIENFGLYASRQTLNLKPGRRRPIVLVGGTNGAGKTTILEALTLCLHGRRALGPRVALQRYEDHVTSRLHCAADANPAAEAEVALTFEHVHSGHASDYVAARRWRRLPSGRIRETLSISKDGDPLGDLSETGLQDFLDSLLPPGLAGFFLFDGEEIQGFADDANGEHLADAVRRLLGLDVITQLQTDLRRFAGNATTAKSKTLTRKRKEASVAVQTAGDRVASCLEARADLQARIDQVAARVERVQDRLAREGGTLASERTAIEADARKAAVEVAGAEEELRGLIAGLLPFAIAPRVAHRLEGTLEREQVAEEDEIVLRRIASGSKALNRELKADGTRPLPELLRELLGVKGDGATVRLHDVSAGERAVLLSQLQAIRGGVGPGTTRISKRLRRAQARQDRAERKLARVPDDEALASLISDLQETERQLGSLTGEMARLEDEHRAAAHDLLVAERNLRRADESAAKLDKGIRSTELALRTVALLQEYGERAERRRLEQVALDAARHFNRLSGKGELLSEIRIDPETFHVRVVRWDGAELPKERLSAGEKQLFAIAILWALARASQRPLPVVVDTPLARLDHEHRQRILHEYLPHVSHQVIVLSTDTEVDVAAAAQLEPVTARRLFLRHDASTASTSVQEGYFTELGEETARAR